MPNGRQANRQSGLRREWRFHASCRSVSPDVFFGPDGERYGPRIRREREAKRICSSCLVLADCRAYAEESREGFGIWGGASEHERRALIGAVG
ncbi:WhiB family transcriptional regulator [Rhodococcus opacus]|uniref:Transcriptional regulator WhiB n=1 Tax=Rhodococcus opacus TaxID=37919 RepID=O84993_RHOOP|nr:WhiB family transcriptional regulator [Rhodococcus opacus]AAC38803.1 putative transcription factor [Rhodococcus opacus]